MPPTPASVVEQWHNLPRTVLQDKVRQVVKRRDADAKQIWAHVRANSVLAAQVRGALSALRAEVKGTRDEVMWTMWIDQARAILDASPDKAAEKPAVEAKLVEKVAAEPTVEKSAEKVAAEKPVEQVAAEAKPVQKPAAEVKPAAVAKPASSPFADAEPQPEPQVAYAPTADKPRTAPVPPVLFQAPGT
ncbi:hypothetical protein [Kutzneria buriramensis]|uniref:Uncharacterized protein n=1 Tax=Kutzneria buriramensis TaxID=1045776 RepID=A0A3E0H2A6_9PSEU|nr:hypothetical protein [Kutzneria buriramensis]REH37020.1 hypothetical protein BCF44_11524 [Kutzneria buriramensis]